MSIQYLLTLTLSLLQEQDLFSKNCNLPLAISPLLNKLPLEVFKLIALSIKEDQNYNFKYSLTECTPICLYDNQSLLGDMDTQNSACE